MCLNIMKGAFLKVNFVVLLQRVHIKLLKCFFLTTNSTHCAAYINVLKHYEGSFSKCEFCGASSKSTMANLLVRKIKVGFLYMLPTLKNKMNKTYTSAFSFID